MKGGGISPCLERSRFAFSCSLIGHQGISCHLSRSPPLTLMHKINDTTSSPQSITSIRRFLLPGLAPQSWLTFLWVWNFFRPHYASLTWISPPLILEPKHATLKHITIFSRKTPLVLLFQLLLPLPQNQPPSPVRNLRASPLQMLDMCYVISSCKPWL